MARGALRPCAAALLLLAWLGAGAPTSAAAEREGGEGLPLLFRGDPRLPASPRPPRLPPRGPRPRRNWDESRYTGSDVTCEETGLRHLHHSLRPVVCTLPRAHAPLRPRPRLAVMVVGLIDRFYPHGVLRHVVAPAARDGFDVDYCVIVVLNSIANFRGNEDNASSTRPPSWIRSTFNAGWLYPTVNPAWKGIGPKGLRDQLIWQGIRHNASRLILFTLQRDALIHAFPPDHNRWLGHPGPDSSGAWAVGKLGAFKLSMKRFWKTEWLWQAMPGAESGVYHQVILTRDDMFLWKDINMSDFPDAAAIYSKEWGGYCDPKNKRMGTPNDHFIVVGGVPATWYMKPYHEYWTNNDPALDRSECTEDFLLRVARSRGVRWELVPDDDVPSALEMHIKHPGMDSSVRCLRSSHRAWAEKRRKWGTCSFVAGVFARDCYELLKAAEQDGNY